MGNETVQKFSDLAYDVICQKITSGELIPGTKLSRRAMAKLTGVSIIPVIEALHRLEDEGLVESYPHYGSRVTLLDKRTIRDRFVMREAVECEVVRILAKRISPHQAQYLLSLAQTLDSIPRTAERAREFWEMHHQFHSTMAQYTECPSLLKALESINLFHLLQRAANKNLWRTDNIPPDIHLNIVQQIMQRNPEGAENAMRSHMYASGTISVESI
jgi:DNA-binding GntR family transcriptional regulator